MISKIYLSEKEKTLIKLFIEEKYSLEHLNYLISDIAVEDTNFYYLLLLAQYANKCRLDQKTWEGPNEKKLKWINGVLKQTKLRNAICVRVLNEFLSKLDDCAGQKKICLLKDLPMLLLYDNNTTRVIYELPVVVSTDIYEYANKIADDINRASKYPFSKIVVNKSYKGVDVKSLATKELELNDYKLFIPCPEMTLIILLNYYIDKLLSSAENHICFKGFYDGARLIKICDKNTLLQYAECQNNTNLIKYWLSKIEKCFNVNQKEA